MSPQLSRVMGIVPYNWLISTTTRCYQSGDVQQMDGWLEMDTSAPQESRGIYWPGISPSGHIYLTKAMVDNVKQ